MNFYIYIVLVLLLILIYMYRKVSMVHYNDFKINEINNFLTQFECQNIIDYITKDDGKKYKFNNNMYWKTLSEDEQENSKFKKIHEKINNYFKKKLNKEFHLENLELAHYIKDNECQYHYDTCNGYVNYCNQYDNKYGPRKISIIIYLNDDYIGGDTYFNKINKSIKPKTGKMIWFENYNNNSVIYETEHCGNTVRNGKKYICVLWIRYK